MKVLAATTETQGERSNDFCFTVPGELLMPSLIECTGEKPDGGCGCRRSLGGVSSHVATTTMEVVEREGLGPKTLTEIFVVSLKDGGWDKLLPEETVLAEAHKCAEYIASVANAFPAGAILERRGAIYRARRIPKGEQ